MTRHPVFALSDRFVDDYAARSPLAATTRGIEGHDHELDDRSPAGIEALADLLRRTRDELAALPEGSDRDARLAVRVLDAFTRDELGLIERGDHRRDLSHLASAVAAVRETIDGQDRSSPAAWAAVAARLKGMDRFLAGWRESLAEGLATGDVVAARQVRSVIRQLRTSVEPAGTYSLVVAEHVGGDDALAAELHEGLAVTRAANVAAAEWLEQEYLPAASSEDGVGRERYALEAAYHVGRDLDLDETYAWAWGVIGELRTRMVAVAGDLDPDADLHEVVARLKTDPSAAAATQADFAAAMLDRQHRALELLAGRHVDVPVEIRDVEVRLAAPGSPLGAWYRSPSEDLSRPGQIWWSLGSKAPVPLWEEVSTAYHEGFPGHHLQVALALTMGDRLSRVHRLLYWKPGTGEGWALYAERLMDELGFL
ncbi:MAG: DUF885 domain-containing protein, partial [Actinobacteria bacterium]|nr:DUF885 domain-containing protein [Actinomycetota bacterium]